MVAAVAWPGDHDDRTLILADVSRKALVQLEHFTRGLLAREATVEYVPAPRLPGRRIPRR
ncbi:MAG: SDH family Clp fold serine proteinase [Solirubrobacteraceae bacterium]